MNLLQIFGIGSGRILEKGCSTKATVTQVDVSLLYVIKKPVRLGVNDGNTLFSHFITFEYQAEGIRYQGKRFVSPHFQCPHKGDSITLYYDPENPQKYACPPFPPAVRPIGW